MSASWFAPARARRGDPGSSQTRLVAYPELPLRYMNHEHVSRQPPPGGRGVLVADTAGRHELAASRADEVSVISTSFSTVASLDTADVSSSDPYSSQEREDVPVFEQDASSDGECLPPHDRRLASRLDSFSSSTSSSYSDDLTVAEWTEVGIEADHEVEFRASQLAASQISSSQTSAYKFLASQPAQSQHAGLQPGASQLGAFRIMDSQRSTSLEPGSQQARAHIVNSQISHATQPGLMCQMEEANSEADLVFQQLSTMWPSLPESLTSAPIAVQWEVMRVLLHCQVDPAHFDLRYHKDWQDQNKFWSALDDCPLLRHCALPDMCEPEAYKYALNGSWETGDIAVALICTARLAGPECVPSLLLHPLKLEQSCRLFRKYRSSRFLEVRIPAVAGWKEFKVGQQQIETLLASWFTRNPHKFLGRSWAAFFVREGAHATPAKDISIVEDRKKNFQERIMLFSEQPRTRVDDMLNWLLRFDANKDEPFLKLYSRISLALSKTAPVLVLGQDQIQHKNEDILSPKNIVMNDGIGRVSPSLMSKVKEHLGLSETPSAFQARLGSAKGMWIVDFTDSSGEDWIETYPSQRKWECDWHDEAHRTLEIKAVSTALTPARLNLQTLQILSDRASDRGMLREVLGARLEAGLREEFRALREANNPLLLRQWANEKASYFRELFDHDKLGGLPNSIEDRIAFLLDAGFDQSQKYLQKLIYKCQKQMCDKLRNDLKITIGKSTYAYMTVDFAGVLGPNEVHMCFSTFNDGENDRHDLDGRDILVGRCPAHLPSDIQKVKAVFKPELRHLRDVIVFPQSGNAPLADKLSGGDYDGDRAWVCWDEEIVNNFQNSKVPKKPDFTRYFKQDATSVKDMLYDKGKRRNSNHAVRKFLEFSLRLRFLGICTNYKEKLCYNIGNSTNYKVVAMSWLLSELVDLPKRGLIFGEADWIRFRADIVGPRLVLSEPEYKKEKLSPGAVCRNIIDYLKFPVSDRVISSELSALSNQYETSGALFYDKQLCDFCDEFERRLYDLEHSGVLPKGVCLQFISRLKTEIKLCSDRWKVDMNPDAPKAPHRTYWGDVERIYKKWNDIKVAEIAGSCQVAEGHEEGGHTSVINGLPLVLGFLPTRDEISSWELFKASLAFREHHAQNSTFVWQMAGEQLAIIKSYGTHAAGGLPVSVRLETYRALRLNKRAVKQLTASAVVTRPRRHAARQGRYPAGGYSDSTDDDSGSDGTEATPLYELE
ncbi:RNA dependent RNA polymerase-domain-containing protein [Microdochium trichocladiopsis]|uniref:RNA-dependent RNA polymerase n=1 Tax=Microdochium trichocladiopsis TaxID=1682393 RepID=A0A9P8Y3V7_9PEZI|nr:RNA dependent RNA polymerase-domain-containing protein [Microdochium trichocladiopsis]KAH7029191.1 RNA dependent RNA polymerase-domain-containing protein [Microdochium trichocladiopsis]